MACSGSAAPCRAGSVRDQPLDVALVIPLHGPAGILGPSSELCAQLAAEELNAGLGVLGRELRLTVVDGVRGPGAGGGGGPRAGAHGARSRRWSAGTSPPCGRCWRPAIAPHVPYVYSALYEGGEHTPGVFLTGETPALQLRPAIRWLVESLGVRRWAVVGTTTCGPAGRLPGPGATCGECGVELVEEAFVPLGTADFRATLERLDRSAADAVLMLLVGQDAVQFNRQFAAYGLDERCCRLSPLITEDMLLASGADATRGVYAAAGYFESLVTTSSLDFGARFTRRFGADAPSLNSPGESCYEAVRLLAELVTRAGSTDVGAVCATAGAASYEGARGPVRLRGNHLEQPMYLARADGLEFDVIATL